MGSESGPPAGRYPEGVYERIATMKAELLAKLRVQTTLRPFDSEDRHSRERHTREPVTLKPREEPAAKGRRKETEEKGTVEVRIRDLSGKTRITKLRPETTMAEVIEWYGPRDKRAVVMDESSGVRLGSSTEVRHLTKSRAELELKIVPRSS